MSITLPACPACDSTHTVKNGKIHNGKQNFKCRECGRQFVEDPQNKIIDQATKTLIDKLLRSYAVGRRVSQGAAK